MGNISKWAVALLLATSSFLSPRDSIAQLVSKDVCIILQKYAKTNKESWFYQAFQEIEFSSQLKQKILDMVCSMSEQEILARSFILRNRQKIKTDQQLKRQILVILSFLLEKGSVTAYMLREDIL